MAKKVHHFEVTIEGFGGVKGLIKTADFPSTEHTTAREMRKFLVGFLKICDPDGFIKIKRVHLVK